jgi:hypothetical protein
MRTKNPTIRITRLFGVGDLQPIYFAHKQKTRKNIDADEEDSVYVCLFDTTGLRILYSFIRYESGSSSNAPIGTVMRIPKHMLRKKKKVCEPNYVIVQHINLQDKFGMEVVYLPLVHAQAQGLLSQLSLDCCFLARDVLRIVCLYILGG